MPDPAPSSATSGFFQAKPQLLPQYPEDASFLRAISFFLPPSIQSRTASDFSSWSQKVLSPTVLAWIVDAEENPPFLRFQDTFGRAKVQLVTSEGWRNLQALGVEEGVVASGYVGPYGQYNRVVQFLRLVVWSPSSGLVGCPSAMSDGAAKLLGEFVAEGKGADAEMYGGVLRRLLSRETGEAWTSGQWMTERAGGSDVRGTETRARRLTADEMQNEHHSSVQSATRGEELGPWVIDGFKWFSSATDADMALLLAKTPNQDAVSLFYAPLKRKTRDGSEEFNGVVPQRLKNKMGTKALPTAELELRGMRAYLVGSEGDGVKSMATVLTLTRIHTAVCSAGYLGRALAVSRAFAKVRRVAGGKLLTEMPVHVKGLALEHVSYKAHLLLALFPASLLGTLEHHVVASQVSSVEQARLLLRLLTPIAKAQVSLAAVKGIRACMESLGGIGYLENNDDAELNVARIFRDANVQPIWEGTSNIMADDVVRVLGGREGTAVLDALEAWCGEGTEGWDMRAVKNEVSGVRGLVGRLGRDEMRYRSLEIMEGLGWAVAGTLLVRDAVRDGDAVAVEVAGRWLARRDEKVRERLESRDWKATAGMDYKIVFGDREALGGSSKL